MTRSDIVDGTLVLWLEAAQVSRGVHWDGYGHPDREGVGTEIANRGDDTVWQSLMSNRSDPSPRAGIDGGQRPTLAIRIKGRPSRGSGGRIGAEYAAGSSRTLFEDRPCAVA
ncbi:MAG: hypothetical protein M3461_05465 [Pseudomonadota bacterium]|nr:hypothetical protein [Pseudomonadota bacterium]